MKSYYVSYTTYDHPSEITSEEIDFEDDVKINQQTIEKEVELTHSGWYDRIQVRQIIAWSKIEE